MEIVVLVTPGLDDSFVAPLVAGPLVAGAVEATAVAAAPVLLEAVDEHAANMGTIAMTARAPHHRLPRPVLMARLVPIVTLPS